ncbi:MAG: FAD-binding oxidoreductase [Gammaproteobacteria bacterium]|nr:FAD-binding oxidoreductase [Gammaproteobacteria bacterium]
MSESLPQDANENSLWGADAIAAPRAEQLRASLRADVLVVGAGYTGLSSALHLAEKGVSVVLLEASSIGFGGSGRNAGLVNAGIWKNPEHVRKLIGEAAAERFNAALRDTPALVFELVERFDMPCQAQRRGTVHIAHSAGAMSYLEDRCRQLQELGASVELIGGERSSAISGSPVYRHGGILDPGAGTIQPLSYARALATAAMAQGASLFQQSAIETLTRAADRWLATTAHGQVSAEQVIVATNAYADGNSAGVRESTLPVYIFQCATAPLPDEMAASLIPERQGLWDTHSLLTSSRIDQQGRLVMCGPGRLQGGQRAFRQNWMTRKRDILYPQLRGTPWAFHWSGCIGVTSNWIMRVQLLAPGVFAPAGYNGRGIGTGTAIGKYLADIVASGKCDDFPFPIETLYREKWPTLRSAYYDYGTLALQFVSNRW